RAKADVLVTAVLRRAEAISKKPHFPFRVQQIRGFGSYLTAAAHLCGVNIPYPFQPKNPTQTRLDPYKKSLWIKARRLLHGGHPYLTLHTVDFLELHGIASQQIYPVRPVNSAAQFAIPQSKHRRRGPTRSPTTTGKRYRFTVEYVIEVEAD